MSCEVGKGTEGLENELWRMCSDGKVGEWAQPLELFGMSLKQEEMGNTEQLTKHEHLTTELSDKMAVKSSDARYVLCLRNSETGTNSEKVY